MDFAKSRAGLERSFDEHQKIAAYRDGYGELHECSAVCPHFGCIVDWNPTENHGIVSATDLGSIRAEKFLMVRPPLGWLYVSCGGANAPASSARPGPA